MKHVSFELEETAHLNLKIKCAVLGIHIKDYVADLVKKDLEEDKED